jgi:hypothetical protein
MSPPGIFTHFFLGLFVAIFCACHTEKETLFLKLTLSPWVVWAVWEAVYAVAALLGAWEASEVWGG